jgi:hypothetical protein
MLGTYFYNKRVRTSVSIFGSLFNDIHVLRTDSNGKVLSQVKVPLSYAPKRSFLERLEEMSQGEEAERRVAIKLPRMSFEIIGINYDPQRQLPKMNTFNAAPIGERKDLYTGVPYILSFQLAVYAKSQDDALQVVEQIIPYFAPQYTLSVKPFSDLPDIVEDIPVTLTGVDFQDDYEGPLEQRRTIIYNLNFEMKTNFYGPVKEGTLIREVNTNIHMLSDDDLNPFLSNIRITTDPIDVSPDSDYGFTIEINDEQSPNGI